MQLESIDPQLSSSEEPDAYSKNSECSDSQTTIDLNGGEYFDFFKKQEGELKLFQIKKIVATQSSKVLVLAY